MENNRKMKKPSVSVIVPIYNVEKYIDKCLQSLSNQTFVNYEVILVDDGSTDSSSCIAKKWANSSSQYHYHRKDNEGLGTARNYGIKQALADYIVFIDPDDWINICYIDNLYRKIIATKSDIVYCNLVRFDNITGIEEINRGREYEYNYLSNNDERLAFAENTSVCQAIFKKELWQKNEITMMDHLYEDTVVFPALMHFANKIDFANNAIYYYRANRINSLMDTGRKDYHLMIEAIEIAIENEIKDDRFAEREWELYCFCEYKLQSLKRYCNDEQKALLFKEIESFFEKNFKSYEISQIVTVGSFLSSKVYRRLDCLWDDDNTFVFTSLISFMSPFASVDIEYCGNNDYRKKMIQKEVERLGNNIRNNSIVILDLLSEKDNIADINGFYYTLSEAYKDNAILKSEYRIIERNSVTCKRLWENSFDSFVELINTKHSRLIVLEAYLSENHTEDLDYSNQYDIELINSILKGYYNYIKCNYPNIVIISLDKLKICCSKNPIGKVEPWSYSNVSAFLYAYQFKDFIRNDKLSEKRIAE